MFGAANSATAPNLGRDKLQELAGATLVNVQGRYFALRTVSVHLVEGATVSGSTERVSPGIRDLYEYLEPTFQAVQEKLSDIDGLNGVKWKGVLEMKARAVRIAANVDSIDVTWSKWQEVGALSPVRLTWYAKLDAEGWAFDSLPFAEFAALDSPSFKELIGKKITNSAEVAELVAKTERPLNERPATTNSPTVIPQQSQPRSENKRKAVSKQQVRPAKLVENKLGTKNIGPLALDAKWSNYGAYLQKLIETVDVQWKRILDDSRVQPPSGTYVVVTFELNSEGRISKIIEVDNHSTEPSARACVSGITDRAPYGPWTDDMKAMLGEKQTLTFSFYYR